MRRRKNKNPHKIRCSKLKKQISEQKCFLSEEIPFSDTKIINQTRFRYRFFAGSALFCWTISIAVPLFAIIIKSYNTAPAVYGMLSGIGGIIVSLICFAIFKYRYRKLVGYRVLEVIAEAEFLYRFFGWFSLFSWIFVPGVPLLAVAVNNLGILTACVAGLLFFSSFAGIICYSRFKSKYAEMIWQHDELFAPVCWADADNTEQLRQNKRGVAQEQMNKPHPRYTREELDEIHAEWFASARQQRIAREKNVTRTKFFFIFSAWFAIFAWIGTFASTFYLVSGFSSKEQHILLAGGIGMFCTVTGIICFCIFKNQYINLTGIDDEVIPPISGCQLFTSAQRNDRSYSE